MPNWLVEAWELSKFYPENGVHALRDASLRLRAGRVHGLVGENGAGKSTLVQIMAGTVVPDSGSLLMNGVPVSLGSPQASEHAGIVLSYQRPRLARELSVLENLFLGNEPRGRIGSFDRAGARKRVAEVIGSLSIGYLDRPLGALSSGQMRLVSLLAGLLRMPRDRPGLLILDEPTEATTPPELDEIFAIIRETAAQGHGVLIISHKLTEIVSLADEVSVLRAGRSVAKFEGSTSPEKLAEAMLGEPLEARMAQVSGGDEAASSEDEQLAAAFSNETPAVELRQVSAREGRRTILDAVSFSARSGEIVGITGIRENGLEAMEALLGGALQPDAGQLFLGGVPVRRVSQRRLRTLGLRYVPTDRLLRGASERSSVSENLIALRRKEFRAGILLNQDRVVEHTTRLSASYGYDVAPEQPLDELSGGTIQKVILSRELEGTPGLLVICEPSWGLDVRAREDIVRRIIRLASSGSAVVIITTDVDEILDLSTRVVVMHEGRIVLASPRHGIDRPTLARAIAGVVSS